MNALATGMAVLALFGAVVPVVHLYKNRHKPGAVWILVLCCVMAAYPLDVLLIGGEAGVRYRFATIGLVAPLYLFCVVAYLQLQPPGWKFIKLLLGVYLPLAFVVPWAPVEWYVSFPAQVPASFADGPYPYALGPGAWVMKLVSYACVICGAGLVLSQLSVARHSRSYLLSLGLFPVWTGIVDLVAALTNFKPYPDITTAQICTTFVLFALSFVLLRQQMLVRAPVPRSLLVSHLREGVCVVSADGVIADCNDALVSLLGVTTGKLIGGMASRLLPEALLALLDRQRSGGIVVDEELTLENTNRHVTVSAKTLEESDAHAAILLTITDITQSKLELESIAAKAGELQEMNEHLEELSNTDPLTGLGNRRLLHEALSQRSFENLGTSTGLLMVDIDHFKAINDTHGHSAGDEVLVRLAKAMRDTCRDNDLIVRWGGEEFVVLLNESNEQRLQLAAERLRMHIRRLVIELPNGVALQVTASIGATLVRSGQSPESALRQVDRLLLEAKQEGRDRVKSTRKPDPGG